MKQYNNEMARNRAITLHYVIAMLRYVNAMLVYVNAIVNIPPGLQMSIVYQSLLSCNEFMKMYLQLLSTTLQSTGIIHSSNGYSFAIGRFVISPPAVRNSTERTSPSFPFMSP